MQRLQKKGFFWTVLFVTFLFLLHNPNTFSLSSLSSLSHLKLTPSKVVVPPGMDPGTPRTPNPFHRPPMPSHACDTAHQASDSVHV